MTFSCSVYGLRIDSDRPIDGLEPAARHESIDCSVITSHFPELPPLETIATGDHDDPVTISRAPDGFLFAYADGTRFFIRECGRTIFASWIAPSTPEDMATYLLGPVLAFVLRWRGVLSLHASAIATARGAIAIVAPPGGGKSTTAAAFAMRGVPVLTDDVLPIVWSGGVPFARSAYPRIRLWPESVEALFGSPDALPLLTPTWTKRYLPLREGLFQRDPLPLHAIAVIDSRSEGPAALSRMTGVEAAVRLVANTSQALHLDDAMRGEELGAIAALVDAVPVHALNAPAGIARIGELCDAILGLAQ